MIFQASLSSVPPFHSLGNGTAEQDHILRNTQWNTTGTSSLKALANKVLERNTSGNKPGTETLRSVPLPDQPVPLRGTNFGADDTTDYDSLSYEFEERAAIAEYDGQQAQRIAYLDAFISILSDLAEKDHNQDWPAQKIKKVLANLEAQRFPITN